MGPAKKGSGNILKSMLGYFDLALFHSGLNLQRASRRKKSSRFTRPFPHGQACLSNSSLCVSRMDSIVIDKLWKMILLNHTVSYAFYFLVKLLQGESLPFQSRKLQKRLVPPGVRLTKIMIPSKFLTRRKRKKSGQSAFDRFASCMLQPLCACQIRMILNVYLVLRRS